MRRWTTGLGERVCAEEDGHRRRSCRCKINRKNWFDIKTGCVNISISLVFDDIYYEFYTLGPPVKLNRGVTRLVIKSMKQQY